MTRPTAGLSAQSGPDEATVVKAVTAITQASQPNARRRKARADAVHRRTGRYQPVCTGIV